MKTKAAMITLYHGSLNKIENFREDKPMYFSESIEVANDYIMMQNNGEIGEYGFIYKVEISFENIVEVEDIDMNGKIEGVLFDGSYYRIDFTTKFNIIEMSDSEITEKLR